jgi:hypothetical protein
LVSATEIHRAILLKPTNWKDIAELIGITAIVASLFFVGLQLKQSQDVVLSELDVAINALDIELTATIGDHADIWFRGNSGAELDGSEQAYYSRLISNVRLRYQSSYRRNMRFDRENVARANVASFAVFLHTNPGAKRNWKSRRDTRRPHFQKLGFDDVGGSFDRAVRADLETLAQPED